MNISNIAIKHPKTSRPRVNISQVFIWAILLMGAFISMVPFIWMAFSAFKPNAEVQTFPPTILPKVWTLENMDWAWNTMRFPRLFANSMFVSVTVTVLALYTSALVGYVLEKFRFPGKNFVFMLILSQMFIPSQIGTIIRWFMFDRLGLRNTLLSLIIPGLFSIFGIFLMRQFMHTIPEDLLDAGRVDGCSEIGIFHRIVLPNMGPALSSLGIFIFMWTYNDFFWPLIILNNPDTYTVPLGLSFYQQGQYYNNYAYAMAGATIAVIPVIVVFLILQRQIVEGVTLTGLAGR